MVKIIKIEECNNLNLQEMATISSSRSSEENLKVQSSEISVDGHQIGIWECSPGYFRRQIESAEYCYIISGYCHFTYDDGEEITLKAGDSAYFPRNTPGEWHIVEMLRKSFFILE